VAIFFVISAFLLYRPFVAGRFSGGAGPRIREFARRRVLRIIPAYWVALTCLAIFPGLVGVFGPHWWRYYGFLQYWFPSDQRSGLPVAWSLSVEATYYVILAVLAAAGAWLAARWRVRWLTREAAILCVLLAVAVAWQLHPVVLAQTFFQWFVWFGAGMALAIVSVALEEGRSAPRFRRLLAHHSGWCWLPVFALAIVLAFAIPTTSYQATYYVNALYALLVVVPAVFAKPRHGAVMRLLSTPVLSWLGLISYGIYLWHRPILDETRKLGTYSWLPHGNILVVMVLTLAVTVIFATTSYYLVEAPLLRLKHRSARAARPNGGLAKAAGSAHVG
jgi:peptidoglycan/LPS O-acetylase OafA/YrhL